MSTNRSQRIQCMVETLLYIWKWTNQVFTLQQKFSGSGTRTELLGSKQALKCLLIEVGFKTSVYEAWRTAAQISVYLQVNVWCLSQCRRTPLDKLKSIVSMSQVLALDMSYWIHTSDWQITERDGKGLGGGNDWKKLVGREVSLVLHAALAYPFSVTNFTLRTSTW